MAYFIAFLISHSPQRSPNHGGRVQRQKIGENTTVTITGQPTGVHDVDPVHDLPHLPNIPAHIEETTLILPRNELDGIGKQFMATLTVTRRGKRVPGSDDQRPLPDFQNHAVQIAMTLTLPRMVCGAKQPAVLRRPLESDLPQDHIRQARCLLSSRAEAMTPIQKMGGTGLPPRERSNKAIGRQWTGNRLTLSLVNSW